jgi:O-6-methylguanine DNA methyltransferase
MLKSINKRIYMREYNTIKKNIVATSVIQTPLGDMFCIATNKGICLLSFFHQKNLEKQIQKVKKFFKADPIPAHNKYFECLQKELDEYFANKRQEFTVPLQLVGTPFQQSVWKILMAIPYGEKISYKEEAILLNNPKAVRAVANANAQNLISIIIPCHRVIQTNGGLGGYAGGIDKKQTLLKIEDN